MGDFARWQDRERTKPPAVSEMEFWAVMKAVEDFASAVGRSVAYVDNALWLICAKSGRHLSNRELITLSDCL
jgi:hypothetical protein